jgi:hypothetical protein
LLLQNAGASVKIEKVSLSEMQEIQWR